MWAIDASNVPTSDHSGRWGFCESETELDEDGACQRPNGASTGTTHICVTNIKRNKRIRKVRPKSEEFGPSYRSLTTGCE